MIISYQLSIFDSSVSLSLATQILFGSGSFGSPACHARRAIEKEPCQDVVSVVTRALCFITTAGNSVHMKRNVA